MKAKLQSFDLVTGRVVFTLESPDEETLSLLCRPELYQGCEISIRYSREAHTVGLERQRARWFSLLSQILKHQGVYDNETLMAFHNDMKVRFFGSREVRIGDNTIQLTPSINAIEPEAIKEACDIIEQELAEQNIVFYDRLAV